MKILLRFFLLVTIGYEIYVSA